MSSSAKPLRSINPATGEEFARYEPLGADAIEARLARAAEAYRAWRKVPIAERARIVARASEVLLADQERWSRLMTQEMGKPLQSARDEVDKCAWNCRYYAENAERMLAPEPAPTAADESYVLYQPLGPVLAVMPWNFPFWQLFRFAAPALMAGNVALLKHASNVPGCALAIEEIFRRAGAPEGVFQTLLIGSAQVRSVLEDRRVAAVTLTGSDAAGAEVASIAGRVIKKAVLELGGSDPFIVMPSVDLAHAVEMAVKARTINNGESCIAAKRFLIHEAIADEFIPRFARALSELRVGDPMDPATQIGPLATPAILDGLVKQVEDSVRAGARLVVGGRRLDRPGNFFAPALIDSIPPGSTAYTEEFFGPVALVFRVRDLDEAIRIANDSRFGLGSSLWSEDAAEASRFVEQIESGAAFVNGMVASDPRIPFGGVKSSGYGRELARHGILEFCNAKTVWIKRSGVAAKGARSE